MKLNYIQKQIYNEYKKTGRVWADCPRQSGKTELLIKIACEELLNGKKVFVTSFYKYYTDTIINKIVKEIGKNSNLVNNEDNAEVVLYDEIYYDDVAKRNNVKILCLRTPLHKTLRFNYKDMEHEKIDEILRLKNQMSTERFEVEFDIK